MAEFLDAVVVTGAGRGLGRAVALHLGKQGLPILCLSRTANCEDTAAAIRADGGQAEALRTDLAKPDVVRTSIEKWICARPYNRLAVVLAAAFAGKPGGIDTMDAAEWQSAFTVNVIGNLAALQGVLPRMRQARFGRIVTLAGGGAAYAYPVFFGYGLSKAAVVRATENLHEELKEAGDFLTVCLAPGALDTDMLRQVRAAGALVKTTVPMEEPVHFIERFVHARSCAFSGRFVHVRDPWAAYLDTDVVLAPNQWLLRRVEP